MRQRIRKNFRQTGKLKIAILLILSFILVTIIGINMYINSRDVSSLHHPLPQPTIIYDKNGEIASKVPGPKIDGVSFDQIPDHVINAVIAIEDHRFYEHPGVDYVGIFRALFRNIKAGGIVEGGSTITQQLTKNVLLTQEQTLDRKIDEFFIAQKIERTFSKEKILEMYVNQIYFGEGAWGIKNAALVYFGKDVKELTVSEGAILAGLIKAPSKMNPLKNLDLAFERRDLVLEKMEANGFLNKQDVKVAKAQEMTFKGRQIDPYEGKYPHYIDHIIDEAITKYHLTQNEVLNGGLQIYTELDSHMQTSIENVFASDKGLFPASTEDQLLQSGAILIDPKTGGINALVGGRGKHVFRGFNHATQLKRQPGSSIKPLAVYTPALEKGYSIYDVIPDQPMDFNGYQPANVTGRYKGSETIYDALTNSDNVPAVWLLNKIGLSAGIDSIERFGLPITEKDHNLSLALGGLDTGVAPIHMAEAYTTFPNGGKKTKAHAITKIIDSKGTIIAEWKEEPEVVTSPDVANRITFMLKGVIDHGTGKNAKINGRELAGKTGSTQLPIEGIGGTKDQWMVGYTPELVGAIWLGYDNTDKDHYLTTTSGATAAFIFKEIIEQALSNTPVSSFNLPVYQQPYTQKKKNNDKNKYEDHGKKQGKNKDKGKHKWKEKKKKHHDD
ncbi:transglycosylase domain-containing protein [Ferdinandcohnia quinoae]|uniref:PBP1A family penicillin-binding protein n=1 Tax=Fredinandcohnia quinoae TaxID=2918902 RepID=A0AAW5ED24_9BACI|nr:PBP1A family penicillin-binding protein [Fredinandcohnia sp. SECRCQ15]MCH1627063.1 PBP1A family penicillin-binding protein [Fredinandcohnia sp. SECRCQ15]